MLELSANLDNFSPRSSIFSCVSLSVFMVCEVLFCRRPPGVVGSPALSSSASAKSLERFSRYCLEALLCERKKLL